MEALVECPFRDAQKRGVPDHKVALGTIVPGRLKLVKVCVHDAAVIKDAVTQPIDDDHLIILIGFGEAASDLKAFFGQLRQCFSAHGPDFLITQRKGCELLTVGDGERLLVIIHSLHGCIMFFEEVLCLVVQLVERFVQFFQFLIPIGNIAVVLSVFLRDHSDIFIRDSAGDDAVFRACFHRTPHGCIQWRRQLFFCKPS